MQDKETEGKEGVGAKRRGVERVVVAPPWKEARESFSTKVVVETRPENVKGQAMWRSRVRASQTQETARAKSKDWNKLDVFKKNK